jgi:hypothetical protein
MKIVGFYGGGHASSGPIPSINFMKSLISQSFSVGLPIPAVRQTAEPVLNISAREQKGCLT